MPVRAVIAAAAVVAPEPPLATPRVPVTPGVMLALPSKVADEVDPRLVWTVLPVVSVAAEPVVDWFRVGKSPAAAIDSTPVVVVFLTIPVDNAPKNCAPDRPVSVVP